MSDAAALHVTLRGVPSGTGYAKGPASAGLVTVTVNGTDTVMHAARGITFALGDRVAFIRVGQIWVALCLLGTAATAEQPDAPLPPRPRPPEVTGTKTFLPVETRSRQGSRWRTDNADVYQGQYGGNGNHIGCAFYGSGPRSLAGATVLSATAKVRRRAAGGAAAAQDTTLRLVTEKTRPSGAPTLTSTTDGPNLRWGQATTFTVPTSWAQSMVDGTAGGLAIYEADGAPYVILDGKAGYGSSFALTINWRR
jgi:hypothetical protein